MTRVSMPLAHLAAVLVAAGCAAGAGEPSATGTKVERIEYQGWPDAWRLSNGKCEAVVVPAVGRVMRFARAGGANLFWENPAYAGKRQKDFPEHQWINAGGEKLWPTAQEHWKALTGRSWPPDPAYDGGLCEAEAIPGGVRVRTAVSGKLGARGVREFTLWEDRAALLVRQFQEKVEGAPVPLCVWTVAQVRTPVSALLPLRKEEPLPEHWRKTLPEGAVERLPTVLVLRNDPHKGRKVGVGGPEGWTAAVIGTTLLVQSHRLVPDGAYPDGGAQAELYAESSAEGGYTELELLSPLVLCKPGDKLRDDALWQVEDLAPEAARAPEAAAAVARAAHSRALERLAQD